MSGFEGSSDFRWYNNDKPDNNQSNVFNSKWLTNNHDVKSENGYKNQTNGFHTSESDIFPIRGGGGVGVGGGGYSNESSSKSNSLFKSSSNSQISSSSTTKGTTTYQSNRQLKFTGNNGGRPLSVLSMPPQPYIPHPSLNYPPPYKNCCPCATASNWNKRTGVI